MFWTVREPVNYCLVDFVRQKGCPPPPPSLWKPFLENLADLGVALPFMTSIWQAPLSWSQNFWILLEMLWIVSWSNLDGEWSVVSQRVLVTPHWIGDHQIKGHKYPTIYTQIHSQIRTNIPLLIRKCSTTNHKYPTTYTQILSQILKNTQPLLLRLSCIPCTNILRPHLEMNGTDNTPIATNIYQ